MNLDSQCLQPDRLTSMAHELRAAMRSVVEDKLGEGLQFKDYFDRAQVEILSEVDKKEKVGGSQLKPSAVKLEKCITASADPSNPTNWKPLHCGQYEVTSAHQQLPVARME
eukprot:Nk52_evm1s2639 gene=Nk52_evmTU1s2639